MRLRAKIEYDGSAYQGFQKQLERPTIQGELERAIESISGNSATIIGAGRTDSGVHALGQVISFELSWRHGLSALQRAINANLPDDIAVRSMAEVDDSFHPRYSAKGRWYRYTIYNEPVRSPLRRRRSWHVKRPLDVMSMDQAASYIVGKHDFATFGKPPKGDNTVREVFRANWRRDNDVINFDIEANAFLYRMVRSLVGTFKAVGEGAWTVEEFIVAMAACDRNHAGQTAPACGLCLMSVTYE